MPTLDEALGAADPLDAAIDRASGGSDARRRSLSGAVQQNPDEFGKAVQLGRATGIPAPVVARNLPRVEQRTKVDALDAAIAAAPVLQSKMESPDFANLAVDDVETLKQIEAQGNPREASGKINGGYVPRYFAAKPAAAPTGFFGKIAAAFDRGLTGSLRAYDADAVLESTEILKVADMAERGDTAGVNKSRFGSMFAGVGGSPEGIKQIRQRAQERYAENITEYLRRTGDVRSMPLPEDFAKFSSAKGVGETLGTFAEAPASVTSQLLGQSLGQLLPTAPLMVGGGLAGGARGLMAGTGASSFATGYVNDVIGALDEMKVDLKDANAVRAAIDSPEFKEKQRQAFVKNTVVGAVDAATAGIAGLKIASSPMRELAAQTGVQMAGGAGGEVLGSLASGQDVSFNAAFSEAIAEIPGAAFDMSIHAANKLTPQREKANAAVQDAEALAELSRLSALSKTRPRDVQSFEDFVGAAHDGGPVQEVFIDVASMQQAGIPPEAIAALSPTAASQMAEAIATGGDLVIPVKEYAGRIAGSEIDAALLPHLRTAEDALSLDEAQRFYQSQEEDMRATAAQVMEERATDDAFQASAKAVETQIFDQLKSAGRFTNDVNTAYSTLMRDFYVTTADRLGLTPEEMLNRYPLQIKAESVVGEQQLNQPPLAEMSPDEVQQEAVAAVGQEEFQRRAQERFADMSVDADVTEAQAAEAAARDIVSASRKNSRVANAQNMGDNTATTQNQGDQNGQSRTNQPAVQASQEPATIGGGTPRMGWAEATRIRSTDGKPVTVYRGAGRALGTGDFETGSLGHATGNPSSGLGVWFTANREDAAGYGDVVEPFFLDIRKPKVYRDSDIPAFDSLADAQAFARDLQAQGFDGIAVDYRGLGGPLHLVAFASDTVITPPAPKAFDLSQFFQSQKATPQTETPEFKRWFGDSKVVDENGAPLVVYHGTNGDFSAFDPEKIGSATDDGHLGKGFYFSTDPRVIGQRAIGMPVYLRAENPLVVQMPDFKTDKRTLVPKDLGDHDSVILDYSPTGYDHKEIMVRSPEQIKSAIGNNGEFDPANSSILAQPVAGQGGNRGEISFGRDITQSPSIISLFKNADLSTFLHEMGHFQLEVLANIASRPDAPQGIVDDMAAALNWFKPGMTLEEWNALPLEEKRPYHEQFARGFEAYLFEGKAPSAELRSLFQRFRAWLTAVYRSALALDVDINDDIRGVFNRLLASEDAIKAAEEERSYTPLFNTPEEMGDTQQAWADYERLGVEASRDAQDELQKRSAKDMQWLTNARNRVLKQLQRDTKEKRAAVEAEVRAEVQAQPVYAARRLLKAAEKDGKISTLALEEMYMGEGDRYALLDWKPLSDQRMTSKEGVHPDVAAARLGFDSGDQMVREMLSAQPEAEVIEGMTGQRLLERYGDIVSAEALGRAADEAIHNEARARFVATELKALSKAQGPVRAMTAAAKAFAENLIARKKVKDIKPSQHGAAEARAAKNAEKALKAGDSNQAAVEKRNQLVQNYATRAAYDAVAEIEKAVRYLRKFDSEGVRKSIDTEYTDQIDKLLERFDLRASVTNTEAAKRESLLSWVESQRQQGLEPDIPPELLSEAARKPYREMTLEELRGLVDAIKQIEHLGRLKQKLLTAKDEREFKAVTAEISQSIAANANGRSAETRTPTDALGKLAKSLKRFWASHIKTATWSYVMDGGEGGPMWEYFHRTANEKGDQETQMRADATLALSKVLSPIVKKWPTLQGKGRYFESVGRAFTREGALAVALNSGNAGNLQRLLGGEGWTFDQIRPVLESLTAQEWQAVQAIWDHFDSYRPMIAAKERRIYGKEPDWVEPVPFTIRTADGETVDLKGGYYPIKYDAAASQRAEEHADAEAAKRDMQGAYTAATTRRSFTKNRSEEVTGRPLLYSLVGVYSGVNDVIHDLAWHEWLIDANRLLKNRNIDQAIRSHYGPEVKDQYKQWVKDVAQGEARADSPAEVGVSWLRQSVSAAGLGFNVMSAAMQVTGFGQSIARVGAADMARGIAQYAANPIGKAREVVGKSSFMEARSRTQFRELNELRNQVEGQTIAGRALTTGAYFLMMRVQKMVDVPTWLAAYEKAIGEGNNEERSISLADQAVIDAQGSGMVKDLSTIERGGPAMKLFTVFYSFMNTALNVGVQAGMTERNKAKLAMRMLMIYTVPAVLGAVLKDALTPGDSGNDDPEKLAKKLLAEQAGYLTGLMVGVREFSEVAKVVTGAEGMRQYTGPAGVRVVADALKMAEQAKQGEFDDSFRRASVNLLGDLTGLPAAQINRTITGIKALDEGETDNPAAVVLGYQKR